MQSLEIVHVDCDHIQIVDEPYIAKVGADLSKKLAAIAGTQSPRPEPAGSRSAESE